MLGACLDATTLHSMPAVLSKELARVPLEEFYSSRRRVSSVVSVPVDMLQGLVSQKRMTFPGLSWSSFAAKEGVREPELAQELLLCVNPLPRDVLEGLASKGHDPSTMIYWTLEEEVHAFREVLNNATADLRDIWQNAAMGEKWVRRARKRIEVFLKAIAIEVDKGRSLACWFCREPVDSGNLCGLCRKARYCSRRCQKNDWETHRQMCAGFAQVANP